MKNIFTFGTESSVALYMVVNWEIDPERERKRERERERERERDEC